MAGTMVVVADGRAVVSTGPGDDMVSVSTEPATGWLVIDVNGVKHYQPRETKVTIRGGQGVDVIAVSCEATDVVCVEVAEVAGFIKLDGSPEFREQVLSGLNLSESRYLTDRPGVGNVLTIRELSRAESRPEPIMVLYHEFGRVWRVAGDATTGGLPTVNGVCR